MFEGIGFVTQNTLEEDKIIKEGRVYSSKRAFSLNGGISEFVIDFSEVDATQKKILFLPPIFIASGGPVVITCYFNCSFTGGTQQIIYNRNRQITRPTPIKITKDSTINSPGTEFCQFLIPANSNTAGFNINAGTTGELLPLIPADGDNNLRLSVNNLDDSIQFEYNINWSELNKK